MTSWLAVPEPMMMAHARGEYPVTALPFRLSAFFQ
jgi:hypothetical protein